jgi:FkbM family methyltransferase
MLDALNAAVSRVPEMPRVHFHGGNPDGDRWLAKKHADGKVHEPGTLAAMLAISERIHVREFWDIGALYGYFAMAAQQIFVDVHVMCMEMHPAAVQALVANVNGGSYREVECLHLVASDVCKPGVRFWISGFNIFEEPEGGWDKLPEQPGAMKDRGAGNRGRGWARVDFATIDAVTVLSGRRPDLIKIDVEGYQGRAVAGMVETLKAYRPHVVIELHDPEKLARFGVTNASTVQPFFDQGYQAFWCGNFRDAAARFEAVTAMDARHEQLSIMVMVP